jgi:hypothetical protein
MRSRPFDIPASCHEAATFIPLIVSGRNSLLSAQRLSDLKTNALAAMDACDGARDEDRTFRSALMHFLCGIADLEKCSRLSDPASRQKLCSSARAKLSSADFESQYA